MENKKYTWKPDIPDFRDHKYSTISPNVKKTGLPPKVDFRNRYRLIYDQGYLGSCTSNAIAMAIDFERVYQNLTAMKPSRLYIYYNERVIENSVPYDAGASLRDGIKSVSKDGSCPESEWPYVIENFTVKPPDICYTDGRKNLVKQYLRLNNTNLNELKTCLSSGYGFVFGFSVFSSFETLTVARTGMVPLPSRNDTLLGGHACYCVGYDDSKSRFIVRNSWGDTWGDKGHFYIPYSYLTNTNYADDFWTIRLV
jgi:C1A family cysteine protease